MSWQVFFDAGFEPEFDELPEAVQDELLARAKLLEQFGPMLGRPHVDTLKGSRHNNMKNYGLTRIMVYGVWLLLSTRDDMQYCWSAGINREAAKRSFTGNLFTRPTNDLLAIWLG